MPHPDPTDRTFGPPVDRSVANGLPDDRTRVTVDLVVRALSAESQPILDEAVTQLRAAIDCGAVAAYDLVVLGDSFDPHTVVAHTDTGQRIAQRIREIRNWANRTQVSVAPYFHEEDVDCRMSGDHYGRVRFPTLCLNEYHDGELAFVAPATVAGERVDVLERLRTLATGSTTSPPDTPLPE